MKGNGHDAPKLGEVVLEQTVAFIVVVGIFECTKCGVDESIVDGVFHLVEDIVAKEIDRSSRDGFSFIGGWDFCMHVENGIRIVRIITVVNRYLGDDGGDVGGKREGVVEQFGDQRRAASEIEGDS